MKTTKYILAGVELLLISPAALFMSSLFVRNLQPQQYQPAHAAAEIVAWYAARPRIGLWIFLMALPLTVLITGAATLLQKWSNEPQLREAAHGALALIRPHVATVLIAAATMTAAAVLAIVALHVATD